MKKYIIYLAKGKKLEIAGKLKEKLGYIRIKDSEGKKHFYSTFVNIEEV